MRILMRRPGAGSGGSHSIRAAPEAAAPPQSAWMLLAFTTSPHIL